MSILFRDSIKSSLKRDEKSVALKQGEEYNILDQQLGKVRMSNNVEDFREGFETMSAQLQTDSKKISSIATKNINFTENVDRINKFGKKYGGKIISISDNKRFYITKYGTAIKIPDDWKPGEFCDDTVNRPENLPEYIYQENCSDVDKMISGKCLKPNTKQSTQPVLKVIDQSMQNNMPCGVEDTYLYVGLMDQENPEKAISKNIDRTPNPDGECYKKPNSNITLLGNDLTKQQCSKKIREENIRMAGEAVGRGGVVKPYKQYTHYGLNKSTKDPYPIGTEIYYITEYSNQWSRGKIQNSRFNEQISGYEYTIYGNKIDEKNIIYANRNRNSFEPFPKGTMVDAKWTNGRMYKAIIKQLPNVNSWEYLVEWRDGSGDPDLRVKMTNIRYRNVSQAKNRRIRYNNCPNKDTSIDTTKGDCYGITDGFGPNVLIPKSAKFNCYEKCEGVIGLGAAMKTYEADQYKENNLGMNGYVDKSMRFFKNKDSAGNDIRIFKSSDFANSDSYCNNIRSISNMREIKPSSWDGLLDNTQEKKCETYIYQNPFEPDRLESSKNIGKNIGLAAASNKKKYSDINSRRMNIKQQQIKTTEQVKDNLLIERALQNADRREGMTDEQDVLLGEGERARIINTIKTHFKDQTSFNALQEQTSLDIHSKKMWFYVWITMVVGLVGLKAFLMLSKISDEIE